MKTTIRATTSIVRVLLAVSAAGIAMAAQDTALVRTVLRPQVRGHFGGATALDGDIAVVGAFSTRGTFNIEGRAYIYERGEAGWTEKAAVMPADGHVAQSFGASAAVDGETVVVGAWGHQNVPPIADGAAYVYRRTDGVWTEEAKLFDPDAGDGDAFGWAVAIDGDTAVCGSPRDDGDAGFDAGSVTVFTRTDGVWTLETTLTVPTLGEYDNFGRSVALAGDTLFVGAPGFGTTGGDGPGTVYVFRRIDGVWTPQPSILPPDSADFDAFGESVATDGTVLAVGASSALRPSGEAGGAAYVFRRKGAQWKFESRLSPPETVPANEVETSDLHFGHSVAVLGDRVAVGADGRDFGPDVPDAGSVFVFVRRGKPWTFAGELAIETPGTFDYCGSSVALAGDDIAFGATADGLGSVTIAAGMELWSSRVDVAALAFALKYAEGAADRLTLRGVVPPVGVPDTLEGQSVTVTVGPITRTVTLDAKGHGTTDDAVVTVKRGKPGKPATVSMVVKGDFSADLAPLGMDGSADAKKVRVPIDGSIDLGAGPVTIESAVRFTGAAGKSGAASLTR